MTIGGWITMGISMGAFATLFAWCMYKVLTSEKQKKSTKKQK